MSELIKLQQHADELLRDFPLAEPDFEAQAAAITARLTSAPAAVALSDDDLFKAPALSAEPGEPSMPSSVRSASAPKSNFAEMARKSVQKKGDDRAALAKELAAATAQARRPNAELVERVRAAGKAGATSTPFPATEPRSERSSGVVAREAAQAPVAAVVPSSVITAPKPAHNRGTIIGFLGVTVGIAACVALYLQSNEAPSAPSNAIVAAQRADGAEMPPAAPQAGKTPTAASPPSDGVISPDALAAAPAPGVEAKPSPKAAAAVGVAAKPPASTMFSKPAVELEEDPAPPQAVAVHKRVTEPEPVLKPAEGSTGSVPLNPSAGAVSTALGSVRGSAQACLAGQTESVTAVVTFAADGHVLKVSAAGPSGGCIQAALAKARIAPFAKESFVATTTVRPP